MRSYPTFFLLFVCFALFPFAHDLNGQPGGEPPLVLDDFEGYTAPGLPLKWQYIDGSRRFQPVTPGIMSEEEYFEVVKEGRNQFLRAITYGRAHRLVLPNGGVYSWNLDAHPVLSWDWRAVRLPKGAREDQEKLNDSGAAVYVTFDRDWLGRPRSIKYSYSSTLPVGTTVSYNRLAVLVVSSGANGKKGWQTISRNVKEDYRRFFGGEPPDRPVSIMLWSDSNSTGDVSEADFDNIRLLPASR